MSLHSTDISRSDKDWDIPPDKELNKKLNIFLLFFLLFGAMLALGFCIIMFEVGKHCSAYPYCTVHGN